MASVGDIQATQGTHYFINVYITMTFTLLCPLTPATMQNFWKALWNLFYFACSPVFRLPLGMKGLEADHMNKIA